MSINIINIESVKFLLPHWLRRKQTVLIVEDDPATAELIAMGAHAERFNTVIARDSSEALGILQDNGRKFVLVMIDVRLIGMDGWELRRQIMDHWPKIPVLMTSAIPDSFMDMPEGEVVSVLVKPNSYFKVFRYLKRVLK